MCRHENISYATSADWQNVCADCGAVMTQPTYTITTTPTKSGCTVVLVAPSGRRQVKMFRNGYVSAKVSAKTWIESQIASIEQTASEANRLPPCFVVTDHCHG